jgi:branched-chain amino acid aminotransferase
MAPVPKQLFVNSVSLAVALNAEFVPPFGAPAALYIRPQALGTAAQLNIIPPTGFKFCGFVQPTAALLGHASPVDVLVIEQFNRAAPRCTSFAKIGGNYAPIMRWQRQAKQEGFGLTLQLDSRTQSEIEEFSAVGFIGIMKSEASYKLVVLDNSSVIKSVTSDTCVQLAEALGWSVETRPVSL